MTAEEELLELRQQNSLLLEQVKQIPALQEIITQLSEQVKQLQERLAKDSHNSSLPPSSDRFTRQSTSRSLRTRSGKKAGGQPGHQGHTLEMHATPDEIVRLPPVRTCQHCHGDLSEVAVTKVERRQVMDVLPPPPVQVTQYEGEWKHCPHCQGDTRTPFPQGVSAPMQYGPRISAMAVYLTTQQLLPRARTAQVLADLMGVQVSEGTLTTMITRTAHLLKPIEEQIKTALSQAKVIHQDETGLYVMGKRLWMHVTCTSTLTHYQAHGSRGHAALDEIGILAHFVGTSVHDAWKAYFLYGCHHSLCCVHILRELTFLSQEMGLWWTHKMITLLSRMKNVTDQARIRGQTTLPAEAVLVLHTQFLALLDEGDQVHLRIPTTPGKRGKAKQHPARNVLDRLRTHQDAVLAFLHDLAVPFDNNLAERDVRMVKVQQKVSGTFRSHEGAISFCRIRGYLSTLRKQGVPLFAALEATLRGQPLLPSFYTT
jgi:transposase